MSRRMHLTSSHPLPTLTASARSLACLRCSALLCSPACLLSLHPSHPHPPYITRHPCPSSHSIPSCSPSRHTHTHIPHTTTTPTHNHHSPTDATALNIHDKERAHSSQQNRLHRLCSRLPALNPTHAYTSTTSLQDTVFSTRIASAFVFAFADPFASIPTCTIISFHHAVLLRGHPVGHPFASPVAPCL